MPNAAQNGDVRLLTTTLTAQGAGALENIQRAYKAVNEAHRAKASMRGGAAGLAQITFDDPDEDVQHGADGLRLPLQPRQQFSTEEVSRLYATG
jgi:hypothetical protein